MSHRPPLPDGRRRHRSQSALLTSLAVACTLWTAPLHAGTLDFQAFNDRQHYSAVLLQQGRVQLDADWNEEAQGPIKQGQPFKIFSFSFDPHVVLPVVGSGIAGGLAVGAEPTGTLGGDQGFSLHVTPGLGITAFGAVITVAPFDGDDLSANIFRLLIGCPDIPCFSVGNVAGLSSRGGAFFLGVVAAPGSEFERIALEALTPGDPSGEPTGFVPPWQVSSITFTPVPEPSTLLLLAAGLSCLTVVCSRRNRSGSTRTLPSPLWARSSRRSEARARLRPAVSAAWRRP